MTSPAERFLIDFHARHTGATALALGRLPVRCDCGEFASSYEVLAAQVPPDASDILDLACGDGLLLSLLARDHPGARLAGIDMSAGELAAAARRLQGRAGLSEGRAQQLPFGAHAFDVVTCHMALMLMEDPAVVLSEIRRVLRKDGMLAAVVGGPVPPSPALDAHRALLQPRLAACGSVVPIGDRRWRAADATQAMLEAAQFVQVRQSPIEGEAGLPPAAMWDWLMLMYDAHFLDEATRGELRGQFLDAVAPHTGADGCVRYAFAWRLITARP